MKISVLIPAYNAEKYLQESLDSVFSQTYPPYEIIVLDDGSTDGSREILNRTEGIRIIEGNHGGVSVARNRLLEASAGDWIAFQDADDYWDKEKLQKQVEYLQQHPDCDIVFCDVKTFLDDSVLEASSRQKEMSENHYTYILQAALIRRTLFEQFGMFREDYRHNSDMDWLLRIRVSGVKLARIDHIGCYYRIHDQNISLDANMEKIHYLRKMATALRKKKMPVQNSASDARIVLSVVIPAYNAEQYIKEAVLSVKNQPLPDAVREVEIIVVDDGSTDQTIVAAEEIGGVKCIHNAHRNAAAARNTGIVSAKGDFLMFLDADDVLADNAILNLYAPFMKDSTLTASFGLAADFVSEELKEEDCRGVVIKTEPYKGFFSGCVMVKKEVFRDGDVSLFDETKNSGETVDWLLRLREKHDGVQTEALTVRRRIHKNNTGRLYAKQEMKNYAAILRAKRKKQQTES